VFYLVHHIYDTCETCQKRKTQPSIPPAELQSLPVLTQPNQRVHADLFGPLKTSATGKKFLLVMTDAFTKYVELVAIPNKEAAREGCVHQRMGIEILKRQVGASQTELCIGQTNAELR